MLKRNCNKQVRKFVCLIAKDETKPTCSFNMLLCVIMPNGYQIQVSFALCVLAWFGFKHIIGKIKRYTSSQNYPHKILYYNKGSLLFCIIDYLNISFTVCLKYYLFSNFLKKYCPNLYFTCEKRK